MHLGVGGVAQQAGDLEGGSESPTLILRWQRKGVRRTLWIQSCLGCIKFPPKFADDCCLPLLGFALIPRLLFLC